MKLLPRSILAIAVSLAGLTGCGASLAPHDEDADPAADIDENEAVDATDATSSGLTTLTRTSQFHSATRPRYCDDPVPALVRANVGVPFFVWRGRSAGCYRFTVVEVAGKDCKYTHADCHCTGAADCVPVKRVGCWTSDNACFTAAKAACAACPAHCTTPGHGCWR